MLSNTEIKAELGKDIIISPYNEKQVKPNSYDVRLGEWFYVESETLDQRYADYDIYDEESVKQTWTLKQAPLMTTGKFAGKRVLWINPHERVLGHTEEFIGGRGRVTTMIKCRSSIGRSGISICLCAGSGDVGYINRWALEISNHLRYHRLPLVVGEPVAQILFYRTGECTNPYIGKYQSSASLEELTRSWKPEMMLPRLYEDAQKWPSESTKAAAVSFATDVLKATAEAVDFLCVTTAPIAITATPVSTELVTPHTSSREDNVADSASAIESLTVPAGTLRIGTSKPPDSTVILCRRGEDRIVCIECQQCNSILAIEPGNVKESLFEITPSTDGTGATTALTFGPSVSFCCPVCEKDVTQPTGPSNVREPYKLIHCCRKHLVAPVLHSEMMAGK